MSSLPEEKIQTAKNYAALRAQIKDKLGAAFSKYQNKLSAYVLEEVMKIDNNNGFFDHLTIKGLIEEEKTNAREIGTEPVAETITETLSTLPKTPEIQRAEPVYPRAPEVVFEIAKEPAPYSKMLSSSAGRYPMYVAVNNAAPLAKNEPAAQRPVGDMVKDLLIPYIVTRKNVLGVKTDNTNTPAPGYKLVA